MTHLSHMSTAWEFDRVDISNSQVSSQVGEPKLSSLPRLSEWIIQSKHIWKCVTVNQNLRQGKILKNLLYLSLQTSKPLITRCFFGEWCFHKWCPKTLQRKKCFPCAKVAIQGCPTYGCVKTSSSHQNQWLLYDVICLFLYSQVWYVLAYISHDLPMSDAEKVWKIHERFTQKLLSIKIRILLIHIKLLLNSGYDPHMNPLLIPQISALTPAPLSPQTRSGCACCAGCAGCCLSTSKKSNWVRDCYPPVNIQNAIFQMAIEIVDLPIEHGDVP